MIMKIIDAEPIIKEIDNHSIFTENPEYYNGFRNGLFYASDLFLYAKEKDPIHMANGCYCKECQYYEPLRDYPDCSKKLPYGYCYYWKYEEGESPNEVDENDFCSKGVITNART